MQGRTQLNVAIASLFFLAVVATSICRAQVAYQSEENIPSEIRNRADVLAILEKLRFLRLNDSLLGANHIIKQTTQTQIREHEFDLASVVEAYRQSEKKSAQERNMNVEDALPQSLSGRPDVLAIVRKLRYLRANDKNLGENHPSKKSTQEQIRGHEFSLEKLVAQERLPAPKLTQDENVSLTPSRISNEFENPREMRILVQKLATLRANQANYGENHPNWRIIQNEIREHESAIRELSNPNR